LLPGPEAPPQVPGEHPEPGLHERAEVALDRFVNDHAIGGSQWGHDFRRRYTMTSPFASRDGAVLYDRARLEEPSLLDPKHRMVWCDTGELAIRHVRAGQIEEAAHLEPPALQIGAQDRHLVHVSDLGRAERVASGSQPKFAPAGRGPRRRQGAD